MFSRGGGFAANRTDRADRVCWLSRFPDESTLLKVEGFLGSSFLKLPTLSFSLSRIGLYSTDACFLSILSVCTAFSRQSGIFFSKILSNASTLKGTTLKTGLCSFRDMFYLRLHCLNLLGPYPYTGGAGASRVGGGAGTAAYIAATGVGDISVALILKLLEGV